jgi:hypothetical protein
MYVKSAKLWERYIYQQFGVVAPFERLYRN